MNQKIKTVFKYIILTSVVLAGAYFYSFVKMEDAAVLQPDNTFLIKCDGKNLNSVKILFSVLDDAEGNVDFYLYDEAGKEIRHVSKAAADINDAQMVKFTFNKIGDSKGNNYTARIVTASERIVPANDALLQYSYTGFRVETMVVFVLCIAYLIVLAKTLGFIFRK